MQLLNKMDWQSLKHEYAVDAKRLHPWEGLRAPFGGAWVVVRARTTSLAHVNDPPQEEELFICISGRARVCAGERLVDVEKGDMVFFPAGTWHYIENPYDEDFHLYCLWWDPQSVSGYLSASTGDKP